MKNGMVKIGMFLLLVVALGCSKDDTTASCTPITCLNGGVSTADCGCTCPQGFTGSNCGTQLTPSKILISKIRVNYFNNNDNGSSWDPSIPTSNLLTPDIYVAIKDASNNTIYSSSTYYANVLSNGSNYFDFTPTNTIQLPISSDLSNFTISLYDFDGADSNINSPDDLMGEKLFFPYSSYGGFPTTITVTNSNYPVSFTLIFSYVW